MIKVYSEKIPSDFEGTIIDLETIGYFDDRHDDSRRYREIIPVIFGYIHREGIGIFCAEDQGSIADLRTEIIGVLNSLRRPFYAFNADFERGVLFNYLRKKVIFDGELNQEKFESKREVANFLKIPQYGDPYHDNGLLCSQNWMKGKIEPAMLHNRSCLLKERDILLKRGFRKPDEMKLIQYWKKEV